MSHPITISLPDCLMSDAAPLRIELSEGAAKITLRTDEDTVASAHVEISDLQDALALLAAHDQRVDARSQAELDALPARLQAAERERDQATINAANTRIRDLVELLETAEEENRHLTAQTAKPAGELPPGEAAGTDEPEPDEERAA